MMTGELLMAIWLERAPRGLTFLTTTLPQSMSGCITDLDTPARLIDLDAMEHNIQKMAAYYQGIGADLRPHGRPTRPPSSRTSRSRRGRLG